MKGSARTYIEDDKEYQIQTVETNKHTKQPPVGFTREEQGEASTRVVEQEAQFFPDATALGHEFGHEPDDKPKHTRKPSVSNDDKEGAQQQRQNGELKRHHGVWCQREAKIVEH